MIPALAFNVWALGSPFEFAYGAAVDEPGFSGHDTLGLNDDGLFGITAPRLDAVVDLLLANRGLLVLTPVIAAALAGVALMRRGEHRAEANVIIASPPPTSSTTPATGSPSAAAPRGPRFLIPALPFVALGLAPAYRRLPAITLGLAIPSALFMVLAALTFPLIGEQRPGDLARVPLGRALRAHAADGARGLQRLGRDRPGDGGGRSPRSRSPSGRPPSPPSATCAPPSAAVLAWVPIAILGPTRRRRRGDPARRRPEPDLPDRRRRGHLAARAAVAAPPPAPRQPREPVSRRRRRALARAGAGRVELVDHERTAPADGQRPAP